VAEKAEQLIAMMGLGAFREKLVGELSTGTQEPGVLLLDEPSGGVAQRETEAMGPLLTRVQQHTGAPSWSSSTTCRCSPPSATA
jgi:branched-chain amino acid transport system ATP-binding protein